ncbi:UvrABC system protein C [Ruminiclostridium hungatei]|uniref:UvrABC system protein C n=1 Tax=Ruminiclostridium hungatei TaxID=48256 RepID=A0A1V4SKQ6_RUMHU|nr:GIY-YIG nuclease family protein [Ruminiclostridium hungatei]OPX44440.1 UvrABC system protein C [Ruminiclostridium hungatei]
MDIKEAVKKLPGVPGIYLMKNSFGMVIYVGKAKNLKARISQYFQNGRNKSPKISEMVQQIDTFEIITADTELEAFLLECETIRELRPPYNKLLKNYLNYKYIRLDAGGNYPIPEIVNRPGKDKALYFGPFTSQSSVEHAVSFLRENYFIRKCKNRTLKSNPSGCLNLQLGNCPGPCTGEAVTEVYGEQIGKIVRLLSGKDQNPVKELKKKMLDAAEKLEFEKAAACREQLKGIRHVLHKQKIIKLSSYGRNVIAAEKYAGDAVKLFFIKGNRLLRKEVVALSGYDMALLEKTLKQLAAHCFKKQDNKAGTLTQEEIDQANIIYSYLKKSNNGIRSANIPASRLDTLNYKRLAEMIYAFKETKGEEL